MVACGQTPEPSDEMSFGESPLPSAAVTTPAPQATTPAPTPDAGTITPDAAAGSPTPAVSATPDASATPVVTVNPDSTAKPEGKQPTSLKEAIAINDDVIGWIKVPNTNIDYPILYDKKFYYNAHDIYKKSSDYGCIYTYYNILTRNNTVTGHNMRKSGTMLHELHKLQNDKEKLKTKANRTFTVQLFSLKKWEVFALYETKDSEPQSTLLDNTNHLGKASKEEIQAWIDKQKSRSEIDLGVSVSPDDFLMTIVTCGDNYDNSTAQSRLYYFLHCID